MELKAVLIAQGAWSQYLEVGIGPDAEIFTKAPPMSAVGTGMDAGYHPMSTWNNPEPEVVSGRRLDGPHRRRDARQRRQPARRRGPLGAAAGKAKDNNASCAIGPFIRLFDDGFTLDDVRKTTVTLTRRGRGRLPARGLLVDCQDQPRSGGSRRRRRSARTTSIPTAACSFSAPCSRRSKDRDAPGQGFTHKLGDIVTIAAPELGALVNRMRPARECEPWTFGPSR